MTDQPPPRPGNYPPPPPPPPSGGYPPPPPPQSGGYPPPPPGGYQAPPQAGAGFPPAPAGPGPALPQDAYTPWFTRVLAYLIDYIPYAIILGIGWGLLLGTRETACVTDTSEYDLGEFCATGASTIGQLSIALAGIVAFVYLVWNLGYRQGTTGSSIGKGIMKFKIVSEKTGQPIGFGMSVVRELLYLVAAGICGIIWLVAVLFPLWDQKRQTLVDKIISTIALPI
jgi:RDD family